MYRVLQEILAATNSEKEVYVYKTSTAEFSHIATIKDMRTWPKTRAEAQAAGLSYYRQTSVQRDWSSVRLMVEDVNQGTARVQLLASTLTDEQGLLEIDRTLTLTGV
jgi:hypothetical protein